MFTQKDKLLRLRSGYSFLETGCLFTPGEGGCFGTLLAAALLLSPISCGGKSEEQRRSVDVPEVGPIERELLPAAVAQGLCSIIEDCQCLDGSNAEYNDCFALFQRFVEREYGINGYAVEYDAELARGCLDAIATSTCDQARWIGECDAPFTGLRALGEACQVNIECIGYAEGAAICGPTGMCVDPAEPNGITCVATCRGTSCPRLPEGSGSYICQSEDGLRCTENGCAALAREGDSCSSEYDCEAGLFCDCQDPMTCAPGVCRPQLPEGAECATDYTIPCQPGSYCDGYRCIPAEENGGNCGESYHCQSGYCDPPTEHCADRPTGSRDPAVCELLD